MKENKFTVVSKYVLIQVLPLILHAEKIEKGYVFLGRGGKFGGMDVKGFLRLLN